MDGMRLGMDLAVLGTSGAMMLYCAQLSGRLRGLRRAQGETPKALAALTRATEESQRSAAEIALAADRATTQMRAAADALTAECQRAEDLSGLLDGQSAVASRRLTEAQRGAGEALKALTGRAAIEIDALTRAVEVTAGIASEVSDRSVPAAPKSAPVSIGPDTAPVRQRAAADPNPFLRAVG